MSAVPCFTCGGHHNESETCPDDANLIDGLQVRLADAYQDLADGIWNGDDEKVADAECRICDLETAALNLLSGAIHERQEKSRADHH